MKWNTEEFIYGCFVASAYFLFLKWYVFLVAPLCGFFWMLGGQYEKEWRRYGVPIILCGSLALLYAIYIPLISIPFLVLVLSMGYGIPKYNPDTGELEDEGSTIGNFIYFHIANKDENMADILTRGFIGVLFALAMCTLVLINIIQYMISSIIFIVIYPFIEKYIEEVQR